MRLCEFANIFGEPRKGLHSYRLGGVAVVDVFFTIAAAYSIAYFAKWSFINTCVGLFLVGIISHRLFCVRTTIDQLLFV